MSHLKTLDEYTSDELVKELLDRHSRRVISRVCPYCGKLLLNERGEHIEFGEHPVNCTCRFGDIDNYHCPTVLNLFRFVLT